jgi:hypothetical protein
MGIRFIDAWHKAVNLMTMFGARRQRDQYRHATPNRRKSYSNGWRGVNPGVSLSWGKAGIRKHARWTRLEKACLRNSANLAAAAHARGETFGKSLNRRVFNRASQRIIDETVNA